MEPPAPRKTKKFAIATFPVPAQPNAGVVRIGSFIAQHAVRINTPQPRLFVDLYGNDRSFDTNFDAKRSKLTSELNFKTGEGVAWESPTCAHIVIPLSPDATYCHDALPLDGTASGSQLRVAMAKPGQSGRTLNTVGLQYSSKISVLENLPGVRLFAPPIDGSIEVELQSDGRACVTGGADGFPSMEMYQYLPNQVSTHYTSQESDRALPALAGVYAHRSIHTCIQTGTT